MVFGLVDWRLISFDEEKKFWTTHPLIKAYFESTFDEENKKLCHKQIYQYFGEYAPRKPETLEEMQPLFEQVYHGCSAGLYDEVFEGVYWEKIYRRKEHFIIYKFGAWETNLSLVKNFFPDNDLSQMPLVSKKSDQNFLLNSAGLALFSTDRPREAEELLIKKTNMQLEDKEWKNASMGYQNLVDLQFKTGRLEKGFENAVKAQDAAGKAKIDQYIMFSKFYFAWILHLLGKSKKAEKEFNNLRVNIDNFHNIW